MATVTRSQPQDESPHWGSDDRLRYVYLSSAMHSGSTLIACLLGAHPAVSTVGELAADFPKATRCSCGQMYTECAFWTRLERQATRAGIPFEIGNLDVDLQPKPQSGFWEALYYYSFRLSAFDAARDAAFGWTRFASKAREAVAKSVAIAQLVCDGEGTRVFLDTSKNPLQLRFLARSDDIDLGLIVLVRDGRGVMNSIMRHYHFTKEHALGAWIWANRNMERAMKRHVRPDRVFHLRIEDLTTDCDGVCRRLFEFLGVESGLSLDYSDLSQRHIVGNTMRLSFKGEIRADERWRDELPPDALAYFNAHGGSDWNRRFGYHE
jgi:hypothetical protein